MKPSLSNMLSQQVASSSFFDEMIATDGSPRPAYREVFRFLDELNGLQFTELQHLADMSLYTQGITFTVYSDARGTEKIFPFDLIPRLITHLEWQTVEQGVSQRMRALNAFLHDIYHDQKGLKDGVVPTRLIQGSAHYCREMTGLDVPGNVYVHIGGIDLIRDQDGAFLVLEDNLRNPSGVAYLVENRAVMARVTPELMHRYRVRPVHHYPQLLFDKLAGLSTVADPTIAVLTPGVYNSAYFEHSFLASQMGVELVEGQDLLVDNDVLYMKTTGGLKRIDVLYRRVDDDFLDPLVFRQDSMLGVAGLVGAYRAGNVVIANAMGNGVADDKAVYAYVPDIIRYYLGEEPILPNVPTYLCARKEQREKVLDHLSEMVVKPTDASGGYGLLVGSHASKQELAVFRERILARPDDYIAQPIQQLSTHPTFIRDGDGGQLAPRHVDLRPFAMCGAGGEVTVLPGGLTRVALTEGSLVVNSSQGGGSKDTWVLYPEGDHA